MLHDAQPGQGRGGAHRARGRDRATTCSSRTPTSSTTPKTGRSCIAPGAARAGAGRLRIALHGRAAQHAVPALGRQPRSSRWSRTCSTTRRSPTWRRATSSSTASCCSRLGSGAIGSTSSPRSPRRSCKRGIRIYEVPISYTGPRVRRGQEDHLARRLRGAVDAREVPLSATDPDAVDGPAVGGGRRQLRGRAAARRLRRVGARRHERGRRSSSSWSTTARATDRSTRCWPRIPTCAWSHAPGQRRLRAAARTSGTAATKAPIVAVLNPDTRHRTGHRGRAARAASTQSRALRRVRPAAAQPRRLRLSRRRGRSRRSRSPSVTGCSGCGGRATRSPRGTASSTPIPRCRASVDWVSGAAIWLRRRALDEVGGWDERYFMYLEDTDLCWRLRRAGWEVAYEPAGVVVHVQGASTSRRPYRMMLEHHRSACRFAQVAAHRARGPCCCPFAAVYFAVRAVVAMAEHAWRSCPSGRASG